MCIAIPLRLESRVGSRGQCVDVGGARSDVDLLLTPDAQVGQWVLVFLGAARQVIDEATSRSTAAALSAVSALMNGQPVDLHAAFPDLMDRSPVLPAHLLIRAGG